MSNYEANPIGALQQRFQSRGIYPTYEIVKVEGPNSTITFEVQVIIEDIISTGTGSSKQQAKRNAARSMLDKLDSLVPAEDGQQPVPEISDSNESQDLPNIVGALQQMCMKKGFPMPIYSLEQDGYSQPPHRIFVIMCTVGKLKETGREGNKKSAKRKAAQKMFNKLKGVGSGTVNSVANNILEKDTIFDELGRLFNRDSVYFWFVIFQFSILRCKQISEITTWT